MSEANPNDDLELWIGSCLSDWKKHSSQWRQDARNWYDFYAGKQWSQEDSAQMLEQKKQPIVFNRVARTINAVIGLEIQNRQAVQYIPREASDTGLNDVLTSAADWIRDNCDAEDEESESFLDLGICGLGATETHTDYDEQADGKVCIERVDPMEAAYDPVARKKNLRDRRWCARIKRASDADIKEMWPDYDVPEASPESYLTDETEPHDSTPPHYDKDSPTANQPKTRELVCFQWWEKVPYYRYQDYDGQIKELDQEQYSVLIERTRQMGLPDPQVVAQKRKHYRKAYVVGGKILELVDLEVQDGFTLNFMTGLRDRNTNTWFGLVALMMDPQRWANKWLSQIIHILNSSAKGGLIAEKDAFPNTKIAEDTWARSESITWANPGGVSQGKIQPKPQTPMPEGFSKLLDFAVNSINDVPGVNMELMGLVGSNQPGVLENMRKQAGMTVLAVFFDAIRLYRKEQGRVLVSFIRNISDGRLIRIVGRDGAKYVPLTKDATAIECDVVVDEAATSPNNKERVFLLMTQLAPFFEKAGMPVPPEVLDYSPLPAALAETWKEHAKQSKQIPPEIQMKFAEMQQGLAVMQQQNQKLHEENFKLKTDGSIEIFKINKQAQVNQQLAAVKAETESEKRAVEVYEANLNLMIEKMNFAMQQAADMQRPMVDKAADQMTNGLLPALQQMMDVSMSQAQQIQGLGPALQSLGDYIVQGINKAFQDNRVVSSEPVYDPGTARLRAIKRRFGNGDTDELPYGKVTVQ